MPGDLHGLLPGVRRADLPRPSGGADAGRGAACSAALIKVMAKFGCAWRTRRGDAVRASRWPR